MTSQIIFVIAPFRLALRALSQTLQTTYHYYSIVWVDVKEFYSVFQERKPNRSDGE